MFDSYGILGWLTFIVQNEEVTVKKTLNSMPKIFHTDITMLKLTPSQRKISTAENKIT